MLVDGERLAACVAGDKLKLGIGEAAMPRQPGDSLMPEGVGRADDTSGFGVELHDLLDAAGRVLRVPAGLEQVAVAEMGREVRPQGRGEALAEEDIPSVVQRRSAKRNA